MSGWAIVVLVAIVVWGIVQMGRNRQRNAREAMPQDMREEHEDAATQRELEDLRERIKVLERIATDGNTPDARETQRIAAEIEALRDKQAD